MALGTRFTELVGCRVPIMQAPMGTVSSPDLVVAVAEAGGVGSFTALGLPADVVVDLVGILRSRTPGVLAANFLTGEVDRDALDVAARGVNLVDFFWSDPNAELVAFAHERGALVSWQVGSVEDAVAAADVGCDLVVVQGAEAGGHVRGTSPLLPLLSRALDAVRVPVLAAGGIADARSLAAVLAAGADGARIGTRFLATTESGAHQRYKDAVVEATFGSTEITDQFAVCPLCATLPRVRVLSGCVRAVEQIDSAVVGTMELGGQRIELAKGHGLPPAATATGHIDAMAMYAGESAALIDEIRPATEVLNDLLTGAEQLLAAAR
jgi:nitronate monooxygenase